MSTLTNKKSPGSTKKNPTEILVKSINVKTSSQLGSCYWNHHLSVGSTASSHRSNLVSTDVQESPWRKFTVRRWVVAMSSFFGGKKGASLAQKSTGRILFLAKLRLLRLRLKILRSSKIFYNLRWFFHRSVGTDTLRNCKTRPSTCCWPSLFSQDSGHALKKVMFIYLYPS